MDLTTEELAARAKSDPYAMEQLIGRVEGLIRNAVAGYPDEDDLFQEGIITLYNVVQHFDPTRAKFSTYLVRSVRNRRNRWLKLNHHGGECLRHDPISKGSNKGCDAGEDRMMLLKLLPPSLLLSKQQHNILRMLCEGKNRKEISRLLGVSYMEVFNEIRRLTKLVRNALHKEDCL